jgi:hypothetical protein
MITVADFSALTDDLQEIFNETSRNKIAELVGKTVFEVTDTDRRTFDHLVMHGLGKPQEVTPGADLPRMTTNQGDSITYTQRYFGTSFSVTKEMRKFDLHDQIRSLPKTMADATFDAIDQSHADAILNGWLTSYQDIWNGTVSSVGPDGLALFSTVHTNNINSNTYRNQIKDSSAVENPTLSRDAIVQARVDASQHQDPEGVKRSVMLDTLLVPMALEDLAERLVYSTQIPGSANNDLNGLKGKIKEIKTWARLDETSAGTSRSAYWFLYDSRLVGETLKSKFAERPTLDAPDEVYMNKNWDYTLDFFYTVGLGYQAYIWGSQGDNS